VGLAVASATRSAFSLIHKSWVHALYSVLLDVGLVRGFRRSWTAAIASTSEITQLAHSNHTCQLMGDRRVFRKRLIPAVMALRIEALNRYSLISLA